MHPATTQTSRKAPADPSQMLEITLLLRPRTPLPELDHPLATNSGPRHHIPYAQMASRHGADPHDLELVRAFASSHQLHIGVIDAARRTVQLTGTIASIAAAFHTSLHIHTCPHEGSGESTFLSPATEPSIPSSLRHVVEAVLGLHTGSTARRHRTTLAAPAHQPHSLRQLASAYDLPIQADCSSQTIGLIELGGGYHPHDIAAFCHANQLPTPRIAVVQVNGGRNRPAPTTAIQHMLDCVNGQTRLSEAALQSAAIEAAQATVEVTMDLAILAGLAPGAHLVLYFGTADEQGIYHALSQAIHDQTHRPDILSISWGEPEPAVSETYLFAIDRLLQVASHLGITVCASSGDAGAHNNSPDHLPAVNFPASSPYCLACGGTTAHLKTAAHAPDAAEIVEEVVWNATHFGFKGATGGGVSRYFPLPPWQQRAHVPPSPFDKPGRGVPDVAGPADPRCGFQIQMAGRSFTTAGTSAAAPLWAALLAQCNHALGHRCGHIHDHLYHIGHHQLAGLRPVTSGHNDAYQAGPGWNPCTGYGTPSGKHLQHYLCTAATKPTT